VHRISILNSSSFPLYIHGEDTQNNRNRNWWFLKQRKLSFPTQRKVHRCKKVVMASSSRNSNTITASQTVKALVTVKQRSGGLLGNLVNGGLDGIKDLVGKTLVLELVSDDLDPSKFCFLTSIFSHIFSSFSFIMYYADYFKFIQLWS